MAKSDGIKSFEEFVDNLKEFNNGIPTKSDEELAPPNSKKKKKVFCIKSIPKCVNQLNTYLSFRLRNKKRNDHHRLIQS